MTVAAFVVAAALGAVIRHLVATASREARHGILLVNVAGSLLLGLLVGSTAGRAELVVLGTGLCGALTTWSSFAHDLGTRIEDGQHRAVAARSVVSIGLGLAAAAAGLALGGSL